MPLPLTDSFLEMEGKNRAFLKVEVELQLYRITGYFAGSEDQIDRQMEIQLPKGEIKQWFIDLVLHYNEETPSDEHAWLELPGFENKYDRALEDKNLLYSEYKMIRRELLEIELLII